MSISGIQFVDVGDELGNSIRVRTGNGEVVNLTADKNTNTIDEAGVEVAFMGSGFEAKGLHEELNNNPFKAGASFRMTLESTVERENIFG